jgi:cytoskeletal protein CcmA (bactofilin family)
MGGKKTILGLVLILGVLGLSSFVLAERIEITGDHFGDLRVKEGDLVMMNGAFVYGDIRVDGALTVNESSTVLGRIVAKRDSYVLVVNDSRIHGNIVGRG